MIIFGKMISGKFACIEIEPSYTVEQLKKVINTMEGIPCERIVFQGRHLEDGTTLSDYNIQSHSVIEVFLRFCGGGVAMFFLNVKTPSNEWIQVAVNEFMTIREVKMALAEEGRAPCVGSQRLFVDEVMMENHKTLRDYGITREAVVRMETQSESTCCIL